jgi:hypothetical protein
MESSEVRDLHHRVVVATPVKELTGRQNVGLSLRAPSCLASRTRVVWQYQPVPTLSLAQQVEDALSAEVSLTNSV